MNEWVRYLTEFHCAGALGIKDVPKGPVIPANAKLRGLRRKILREEFKEYEDAEDDNDFIEIADALADIIYVAIGTALEYGIPLERVLAEVHRSNMSKCIDGKIVKRADGKILKPDTFSPPDIEGVIFWPDRPSLENGAEK